MCVTDTFPLVSVIVPNYNHAPYLRQRIESVLAQTFSDFELILLDDCSTDESRKILESYASHPKVSELVLNEHNSGSTFVQWARGLSLARGKYVWIAESDDFADPRFLETLVPELENTPDAVMAFSGSHMVDAFGKDIPGMDWDRYPRNAPEKEFYAGEDLVRKKLLWTADVYNASMVVFRRDKAPGITSRQMKMRYCGDWLFWVRLARNGGAVEIRQKLNYFRQHDKKVSPGASKAGLYFSEGIPVMQEVADFLELGSAGRAMLAGRTLKRLRAYPHLMNERKDEITALIDGLSPGAYGRRMRLILWYEIDKFFNITRLQS